MGYDRYNYQGYFGECFVRVLASAAGLIAGRLDVDATGVDFSIDFPGDRGTTRFPKIEVQVKSWSTPRGSSDAWHYPMKARHFNAIAGPGFQVARYLFLVIVPDESGLFAEADVEMLTLRHCGYWVSLAGCEPVSGAQQTITVSVPKKNLLTVEALQDLVGARPDRLVAS